MSDQETFTEGEILTLLAACRALRTQLTDLMDQCIRVAGLPAVVEGITADGLLLDAAEQKLVGLRMRASRLAQVLAEEVRDAEQRAEAEQDHPTAGE